MKQAAVLALDLATTTGWALHRPGMQRPFFGHFRLPGAANEVGHSCLALEEWLLEKWLEMAAGGGISHFFFEAQHINEKMGVQTAYRLISLGAIVEKFAFQSGALCYTTDISTWRKHFIGRGSGFKREKVWNEKKQKHVAGNYLPGENPKELAVQRCNQYGWHPETHDEAEACGILDHGLSLLPRYQRPWRDKILMGGER